jgi:hypothetical protein
MSIAAEGVLAMFESFGEVVALGLAVLLTWMASWAIAERRTVHTLVASYEVDVERSSRRIADLELRLAARTVPPDRARSDRHASDDPVVVAIA